MLCNARRGERCYRCTGAITTPGSSSARERSLASMEMEQAECGSACGAVRDRLASVRLAGKPSRHPPLQGSAVQTSALPRSPQHGLLRLQCRCAVCRVRPVQTCASGWAKGQRSHRAGHLWTRWRCAATAYRQPPSSTAAAPVKHLCTAPALASMAPLGSTAGRCPGQQHLPGRPAGYG